MILFPRGLMTRVSMRPILRTGLFQPRCLVSTFAAPRPNLDIRQTLDHQARISFAHRCFSVSRVKFEKPIVPEKQPETKKPKHWKERYFGVVEEDQSEAGFSEVRRLLKLARKDIKLFSVAIFLLFISAFIVMALPKVTGQILDSTRHFSSLEEARYYGLTLYELLAAVGVLLGVYTAATFGRIIILRVLGEKLVARLRSTIMRNVLRQDMEFFDKNKVGDLISRLSSDAYVVSRSVTQNMSDGIKHSIVGGTSIGMMFYISPTLSMIMFAFGPPLLLASYIYGMMIKSLSRRLQKATGGLTKVAEEQLNNIKTIQSFTAETKELHRYDQQIKEVYKISYKDALTNASFFVSTGVLGHATFLLTLGLGTNLVFSGSMTVGDLAAYMMYTDYCGNATFGVATFYTELFKGAGAASRLFEIQDQQPHINQIPGPKIFNSKGHIEFKNVTFAYPTRPDNIVFDNLSFEIKAGSNVCIVGPSGKGKSTIASLLLRFYQPLSGQILIDGVDITKYSVHSLRQLLGYVQQEPVLIPGTLAENIKYGLPQNVKVTADMIEWAAAKANCDFVQHFPDKFATDIGPKGSQLSGGQKQKIAIARSLIKNPPILILDEATSALDSKSENAINLTISNLMRDQSITTISIAHRLSTIEKCDEVLVLGYDGRVAEEGKFKELYANHDSMLYKLLNETQKPKKQASEAQEEPEEEDGAAEKEEVEASSEDVLKTAFIKRNPVLRDDFKEHNEQKSLS